MVSVPYTDRASLLARTTWRRRQATVVTTGTIMDRECGWWWARTAERCFGSVDDTLPAEDAILDPLSACARLMQ